MPRGRKPEPRARHRALGDHRTPPRAARHCNRARALGRRIGYCLLERSVRVRDPRIVHRHQRERGKDRDQPVCRSIREERSDEQPKGEENRREWLARDELLERHGSATRVQCRAYRRDRPHDRDHDHEDHRRHDHDRNRIRAHAPPAVRHGARAHERCAHAMKIECGKNDPERDRAHPERQRRSPAAQQHHPDDDAEQHDDLRLRHLVAHERGSRQRSGEEKLYLCLREDERGAIAAEYPAARDRHEDERGVNELTDRARRRAREWAGHSRIEEQRAEIQSARDHREQVAWTLEPRHLAAQAIACAVPEQVAKSVAHGARGAASSRSPSSMSARKTSSSARPARSGRCATISASVPIAITRPALHHEQPRAQLFDEVQQMRAQDHCRAGACARGDRGFHATHPGGIEPGEGLIEQERGWRVEEAARDRELLPHAAGERGRKCAALLEQLHLDEQRLDSRGRIGNAVEASDEPEMLFDGEMLEQLWLVGNEGEERLCLLGRSRHVVAAHAHGAARRHDDPGDAAERGRLSRAVGADEAEHFAGSDVKGHASHCLEVAVTLGEALDVDHAGDTMRCGKDLRDVEGRLRANADSSGAGKDDAVATARRAFALVLLFVPVLIRAPPSLIFLPCDFLLFIR